MISETDNPVESEIIQPFGDRLSVARNSLGLTLEELAETLNLNIKILEALESSDIDQLPPAIYVQGYIKAYTKALGISSEDIHEDFLKTVQDQQDLELKPRSPLPIETNSGTPIIKAVSILFGILALSALIFGIYNYYLEKVDSIESVNLEIHSENGVQIELPVKEAVTEQDEISTDHTEIVVDEINERTEHDVVNEDVVEETPSVVEEPVVEKNQH